MTGTKIVGFNYGSVLQADAAKTVRGQAQAIRLLVQRSMANLVEIGRRLKEVREMLPTGHFVAWLHAEFQWSQARAYDFMRVAEKFGELDCLDRFQIDALVLLAPSTVAPEAVSEAIDRARAGELITEKKAIEIRAKHRPPTRGERKNLIDSLTYYVKRLAFKFGHRFIAQKLLDLAERLQEEADTLPPFLERTNGSPLPRRAGVRASEVRAGFRYNDA